MVFILSAPWWIRIRGSWKLPDGRDWLWGNLDDAVKVLHSPCKQIWKSQQWPQDWMRSVFISILKKKQCHNMFKLPHNRTAHMQAKQCSKFAQPGSNSSWTKNFQIVKLDLQKGEEPEINWQHPLDHWKSRRVSEKHLPLLYWLCQAFDCVDHNKLWKILKEMGIPGHLSCLLRHLYAGQEVTVQTRHGTQTGSKLGKECIKTVYCHLTYAIQFNSVHIMRFNSIQFNSIHIMRCLAGWSTRWYQDCQKKYQ